MIRDVGLSEPLLLQELTDEPGSVVCVGGRCAERVAKCNSLLCKGFMSHLSLLLGLFEGEKMQREVVTELRAAFAQTRMEYRCKVYTRIALNICKT